MTMVPSQNLSKQHNHLYYQKGYGRFGDHQKYYSTADECYGDVMNGIDHRQGYDNYNTESYCIGSDLVFIGNPMAEDESTTNSLNEVGSSSKEEKDEGWLQLGIGLGSTSHENKNSTSSSNHHVTTADQVSMSTDLIINTTTTSSVLTDLQLLPPGGTTSSRQVQRSLAPIFHVPEIRTAPSRRTVTNFNTSSLYFQQQQCHQGSSSSTAFSQQEINWVPYRPVSYGIGIATTCSSSPSSLMPLMASSSSYFGTRQFQMQTSGSSSNIDLNPTPSLDFRVVNPPRRPQSGIWFMLQASQNQVKQPFLPQISKSYLRIRDGRMTVRLLMKYLVNKLRLNNESEVEITCRGQEVLPFLTLQHVRDNIWSPRDAVTTTTTTTTTTTLLSESSTTDHVMVLHYGRRA